MNLPALLLAPLLASAGPYALDPGSRPRSADLPPPPAFEAWRARFRGKRLVQARAEGRPAPPARCEPAAMERRLRQRGLEHRR